MKSALSPSFHKLMDSTALSIRFVKVVTDDGSSLRDVVSCGTSFEKRIGDGSKRRDRVVAKSAVASSVFLDAFETISLRLGRAISAIELEVNFRSEAILSYLI